ncbi:MAG TPA: oxidoreductase [Steroidobacteraceae bacterium]|nr:oxidoreductase [Steroidobacteraceae bacterium]
MSAPLRVWFITGCSSGFGRCLAEQALGRGERVVATARDISSLHDLQTAFGERVCTVALDVTRPELLRPAIERARSAFGRIDVVVNNAGYGLQGTIEDVADAQVRAAFETNFFGALAVIRAVLPLLRTQRSGHIVNVSSVGGRLSVPMIGLYSATKFALEGVSVALAAELAPHGIRVTLVEPGAFATRFGGASLVAVPPSAPYAAMGDAIAASLASLKWGDPRRAAAAIIEACDASEPPLRLVLGEQALGMVRHTLKEQLAELERWERLSVSASPD